MEIRYHKYTDDNLDALAPADTIDDPTNVTLLQSAAVARSQVDTAAQTITLRLRSSRSYNKQTRNKAATVTFECYSVKLTRRQLEAALAHLDFTTRHQSTPTAASLLDALEGLEDDR